MWQHVLLLGLFLSLSYGASTYKIGAQGDDCFKTCYLAGLNCNQHIDTNNSLDIFHQLGIDCQPYDKAWWSEDQPSYASDPTNPFYGKCTGYIDVPEGIQCGISYPTARRLCRCDDPKDGTLTFGTGYSSGYVDPTEQTVFTWIKNPNNKVGVMTHFWATAINPTLDNLIVRYYIDGEVNASIEFIPALACGVAWNDDAGPWGNRWFGKGAKDGSYWHNFRIPFQKSVKVTIEHPPGRYNGFFMLVRGIHDFPVRIGEYEIPANARLQLQKIQKTVDVFEYVKIVDVPSGSGLYFMHTFVINSTNQNFMEGCYHRYVPYNKEYPGEVIATGTEDYYDSGWYFDGGRFWLPNAGLTHFNAGSVTQISAYRFHETDPMPFVNTGMRIEWRNGDKTDAAGYKCYSLKGGTAVGSPGPSQLISYAWVYVW